MNDSRSRPPEAHTILGTCSCQEIIHFLVDVLLKQINNQSISLILNNLTLHTPSHTVLTCWHCEYKSSLVGLLKIIPEGLAAGLQFQLAGPGRETGEQRQLHFHDTWPGGQFGNKSLPCPAPQFLCRRIIKKASSGTRFPSQCQQRRVCVIWYLSTRVDTE